MFIAESESDIFFKSVNIWQICKQERGCLVHFLRLLAVCWPGAQSAWDNHAVACNVAKYSQILIFFHSQTFLNLVVNNDHSSNSRPLESKALSTTSPGHDKSVHDKQ